ncbi:hypothetical protein CIG19_13825 [Enterobacterales bacterium CwR94]|nr:hypothetical protein CIG19_13825 [Enterobacterales bacterium CwR94]
MILIYSDNIYFHYGTRSTMEELTVIHTNKFNFETSLSIHLSSISVVLIDLTSNISTWFNAYCILEQPERMKFIFYGSNAVINMPTYARQYLPQSTGRKRFLTCITAARKKRPCHLSMTETTLTDKEKLVISHAMAGKSIHRIAQKYKISAKTVYRHQLNACKKLGIKKLSRLRQVWNGQLC